MKRLKLLQLIYLIDINNSFVYLLLLLLLHSSIIIFCTSRKMFLSYNICFNVMFFKNLILIIIYIINVIIINNN